MKKEVQIAPKLATALNKLKVNKDGYLKPYMGKYHRLMTKDHSPVINIDNSTIETLKICKYIELTYQSFGIYTFNFINN